MLEDTDLRFSHTLVAGKIERHTHIKKFKCWPRKGKILNMIVMAIFVFTTDTEEEYDSKDVMSDHSSHEDNDNYGQI